MQVQSKQSGRVRSLARRRGYRINHRRGGFQLLKARRPTIVMGSNFNASLDEIESFLRVTPTKKRATGG